jgi:hypothetical protein
MEDVSTDKPDLVAQLRDISRVLETRGNTCDAMRCEAAADEIDRLRAEVERHESYGGELEGRLADRSEEAARLRLELAELQESAQAEVERLRERALRAEHEREVMLKSMVEYDPTYPKAPWVVNKPWGYRLPYRWYLTEAEARAAAYRALGLDAAPADEGNPEPGWLDRGFKAIQEDSRTWPAWMKRDAAPADGEGGAP